jgi:hypothetical protein
VGFELQNSPLKNIGTFIAAVFVLSCPFWLAGQCLGGVILPGLPVSALMAVVPALAALIITEKIGGQTQAVVLAARIADFRRTKLVILSIAAILMPALTFGGWVWMQIDGISLPPARITFFEATLLFAVFWFAASAEELGWSGYLAEPARECWGFLGAGLSIGAVWAIWHAIPLLQAGRDLSWIGWWTIGTIAVRIVAFAIYQWSNESVFAVSVFHATQNVAWQSFPVNGSQYDPSYSAPLFFAAAAICTALVNFERLRRLVCP